MPVLPVFNAHPAPSRSVVLQEEKTMESKIDSSLVYHKCWKPN